jgi:inhibitor of cysteine peptidase
MTVLTAADRGSTVLLREGDTVELRLPENGSTGYVWDLVTTPDGVELVDDQVTLPSELRPGADGERRLRFTVRGAVQGPLELALRRPWEDSSVAPAETFDVEITSSE